MAPQLSTLPDVLAGQEGAPAIYVGGGGPEFTRGELNALIVQFAETLRRWGVRTALPRVADGLDMPRLAGTPASSLTHLPRCYGARPAGRA